jgi:site-specific recombinase XerD
MVALKERAGGAAFGLSAAQINEAAAAFRVLDATKLSLTEAVGYAVRHAIPPEGEMVLQRAIEALCKAKRAADRNEKYIRGLEWSLGRFAVDFKNIAVHKVARDDVEAWLEEEDFSVQTRRNYIRDLHILFKFALGRGWTSENPIAGIEKPAEKTGEVSILLPAQAQALLGVAQGEVLLGIAIKTFAGLRTSELLTLDWNDVTEERIVVQARHAKTRRRRVVTVSENLRVWLKPLLKPSGPVAPFSPRQWHDRVSAVSTEAKVAPLPKNVMRHSFCSYHYAKHSNENLTAAEAGNSPAMIFEHYRAMIKEKSQIDEFWAIIPQAQPAE